MGDNLQLNIPLQEVSELSVISPLCHAVRLQRLFLRNAILLKFYRVILYRRLLQQGCGL